MRIQLRIVAGSLRGRKLSYDIHEGLRPTPQMVREALFSILGNAVPDRPFYDLFAGTGVNGMEALSRGAREAVFVERDTRLAEEIEHYLRTFAVADRGRVVRGDVYRWVERWRPPNEPVNVFLSPPFADFDKRPDELVRLVVELERKIAPGSVLMIQGEKSPGFDKLLSLHPWDLRRYSRNMLAIWVKGEEVPSSEFQVPNPEEE